MLRLGAGLSGEEEEMTRMVSEVLADMRFEPVTAAAIRGTADYLTKIIDLIRGCGFGVAIYSDKTPARTMGNIFFEVGVCLLLGKPVQLVFAGTPATPSDFVRTEWIEYKPGRGDRFRDDLRASFGRIEELAEYYRKLGQLALEATEVDLELAFERFKQAVLIANDAEALTKIREIAERLRPGSRRRTSGSDDMASHRTRLLRAIREFLALLPGR